MLKLKLHGCMKNCRRQYETTVIYLMKDVWQKEGVVKKTITTRNKFNKVNFMFIGT